MKEDEVDKIKNEAEALNSFDHPHIVKFKKVILSNNDSYTRARISFILLWNI